MWQSVLIELAAHFVCYPNRSLGLARIWVKRHNDRLGFDNM